MQKFFPEHIFNSFSDEKKLKSLYDLARFIEVENSDINSHHFNKLKTYHQFLSNSESQDIQKLNKEFLKVTNLDYQYQIYLMVLERILQKTQKDYQFLVKTVDDKKDVKRFPIVCLLDSIRSAHNVGAMFRNAECFAIEKMILTGLSPKPDSPHVIKTAMGTEKIIDWEYGKSAIEFIKEYKEIGYHILSVETAGNALKLNELKNLPEKVLLIFGHEQFGVSHSLLEMSDQIIEIPLYGNKNSLNVGMAQGICLNYITDLLKS